MSRDPRPLTVQAFRAWLRRSRRPGDPREPGHGQGASSHAGSDLSPGQDGALRRSARLRNGTWQRDRAIEELRSLPSNMAAIVEFHAANKLLLLAHSERELRALGRVAANADGLPFAELKRRYEEGLVRALSSPARRGPIANALQHAFGPVKNRVSSSDGVAFHSLPAEYSAGMCAPQPLYEMIRGWAAEFDLPWLARQTLFLSALRQTPQPRRAPETSTSTSAGQK